MIGMFYPYTLPHWFNRTVAIQGTSGWECLIEQFQDTHSNLFHMINLPQNGPFTSAYLRQSNTKRYNYPLFQLASQSVFTVALQAGRILYKYNKKV